MTSPLVATLVTGRVTGLLPSAPRPLLALIGRAFRPTWHSLFGGSPRRGGRCGGVAPEFTCRGVASTQAVSFADWSPLVVGLGLVLSFLPACAEEFGWRGSSSTAWSTCGP